jgi:hypothetical protein
VAAGQGLFRSMQTAKTRGRAAPALAAAQSGYRTPAHHRGTARNTDALGSASRRWWWFSAAAGTAASVAIGALFASAASTATTAGRPGGDSGFGPVDRSVCPSAPDERYVGGPWVPTEPTGCDTLDHWWRYVGPAPCPQSPDVRYVGLPWVPAEPTGCDTLDRWWRYVQPAS